MAYDNLKEVTFNVSGTGGNEIVSGIKAVALNVLSLMYNRDGEGSTSYMGSNSGKNADERVSLIDLQFEESQDVQDYLDERVREIMGDLFPMIKISAIEFQIDTESNDNKIYMSVQTTSDSIEQGTAVTMNEIVYKFNYRENLLLSADIYI